MNIRNAIFAVVGIPCLAHSGPYPVVTSVRVEIQNPTSALYHITQGVIDIGPGSDVIVPYSRVVGIGHRHNVAGSSPVANLYPEGFVRVPQTPPMTIGEAALLAYERGQKSLTVIGHGSGPNGGECVGYFGAPREAMTPWATAIVPAASCFELPPGNQWCDLVGSSLIIDHGVVTVLNTTGTYDKSVAATVTCTAPTNIRLRFGQDVLKLGGGVESTLSTTPAAQGGLVSFAAGDTQIQVNSRMTVPPRAGAGVLAASTILTVEYL